MVANNALTNALGGINNAQAVDDDSPYHQFAQAAPTDGGSAAPSGNDEATDNNESTGGVGGGDASEPKVLSFAPYAESVLTVSRDAGPTRTLDFTAATPGVKVGKVDWMYYSSEEARNNPVSEGRMEVARLQAIKRNGKQDC